MPNNAVRRRQLRDSNKAASKPQRRLFGRSALERNVAVGVYVGFMLLGALFVSGAAFWDTLTSTGGVAHAEVAGSTFTSAGQPAAAPVSVSASASAARPRTASVPKTVQQPVVDASSPPAPLPPQTGVASQTSAQQLVAPVQTVAPAPTAAAEQVASRGVLTNVNITFYDCASQGFCGAMYNGRKVYEGAAACSWDLPIGTRFTIAGDPTHRTYICEDRGLLANTWVDIFWYYPADGYNWQRHVGRYGTIEIVSMP